MHVSAYSPPPAALPPTAANRRRARRGAFALVVTLLVLSLLLVVAVSYLSSMIGERQTADAYSGKTRAEQVAQSGVDSAMAILTESFLDFPDSATVWEQQSTNNDGAAANEGTNLYLHAVPKTATIPAAVPGATPTTAVVADRTPSTGTTGLANDPGGNNPSNLACETFVLPLISGVPGGYAQLASKKSIVILPAMNAAQHDPTQQNYTDLNVRSSSTDTLGYIGSPPGWAGTAPKPARAFWVNLKDSGNRITGRYAFWMEDESFRVNTSLAGDITKPAATQPLDNQMQLQDTSGKPRSLQPSDLMLIGPLTFAGDASNASGDANIVLNTRKVYPGNFFPDPLAFAHPVPGATPLPTPTVNYLHYLTTNQSGTLNLTRHGTQRLNLNDVVTPTTNPVPVASPTTATYTAPAAQSVIQSQINQIVQTIQFHLPYFGQRFYRTNASTATSMLNDLTQVPGSPVTPANFSMASNIYGYKVAANLLDYLDPDSQPTVIDNHGNVLTPAPPGAPLNESGGSTQIWAQGKEIAPYIQEVAVRYRPVVYDHLPKPPLKFDLQIDYYVEVWNMSDRDIYAAPQLNGLPNLGGATLHIRNQHQWNAYPGSPAVGGVVLQDDNGVSPSVLTTTGPPDCEVDLTNGVYQNNGTTPLSTGVVFRAGSCTVITTDPSYMNYVFMGPSISGNQMASLCPPTTSKPSFNVATTFYCSNLLGASKRDYKGTVNYPASAKGPGIQSVLRGGSQDADLEVFLGNAYGIIDSVPFALTEYGGSQYTNTDSDITTPGKYNDYSYSSCLFGNYDDHSNLYYSPIPSELGDPRTNNEQLSVSTAYDTTIKGDQSRFVYPKGTGALTLDTTLGYPNGLSQRPDAGAYPWQDYFALPIASGGISYPNPTAANAPMVVADAPLTSIGQLGDVFDPARLPSPAGTGGGILYSRGGGRTFKIGQHDDRYSFDASGNANYNTVDNVPASSGWASWRLADIFDAARPIETPACLNINGIQRDKGAALLALLQGFVFQPATASGASDPVIHGDAHTAASLATKSLDTTPAGTAGFAVLINQMTARLNNTLFPPATPRGPFFERGEFGELGSGGTALFGLTPPNPYAAPNNLLVSGVDTNKTFDHAREELFRRIAQMICTRGDTFTVYAVGQSISQPLADGALKVTGTHRMRVTFRLVPMAQPAPGTFKAYHPGYDVDPTTGVATAKTYNDPSSFDPKVRFAKPDHYNAQVLQVLTY